MSFGGLLGSLYGDLPAPKSGPAPPELPNKQATPSETVSSVSSTPVAEARIKNEATGAAATAPEDKQIAAVSSEKSAAVVLMPLPTTIRRRGPLRQTPMIAPPAAKRLKDNNFSSSVNTVCNLNVEVEQKQNTILAKSMLSGECEMISKLNPQKVANEYDPSRPNSYDEYVKERTRALRKREEDRRQKEERLKEEQRRAMPPPATPPLSMTGDQAYLRRQQLSAALFGAEPVAASPAPEPKAEPPPRKKPGFAQKILEKMGWKQGEGLGREKQGILAPLVARKTDKRSGVIVQGGNSAIEKAVELKGRHNEQIEALRSEATRVVLLTNLVRRGEIDDELESETAEEAAKYGHLLAVHIVEVPHATDEEAVRVFCEYESIEGSLNGKKIIL